MFILPHKLDKTNRKTTKNIFVFTSMLSIVQQDIPTYTDEEAYLKPNIVQLYLILIRFVLRCACII